MLPTRSTESSRYCQSTWSSPRLQNDMPLRTSWSDIDLKCYIFRQGWQLPSAIIPRDIHKATSAEYIFLEYVRSCKQGVGILLWQKLEATSRPLNAFVKFFNVLRVHPGDLASLFIVQQGGVGANTSVEIHNCVNQSIIRVELWRKKSYEEKQWKKNAN